MNDQSVVNGVLEHGELEHGELERRVLEQPWPEPLVPPDSSPEIVQRLRRTIRIVPTLFQYFASVAWATDFAIAGELVFKPTVIRQRWADLALFTAAQENCCRVCYGAQRAFMRVMGYPDSWVDRLERDVQSADLDDRELAIIDFCRKLARSVPRPAASERTKLEAYGLTEAESSEIVAIVAVAGFVERVNTFLAIPPEYKFERVAGAWWGGPVRHIIARYVRRSLRIPVPHVDTLDGPFATVLRKLDDLPWGRTLRHTIDAMLADDRMPARTKLLVFAVVGRALGCAVCTGEAERLLLELGLGDDDIARVLTHLSSPKLDAVERVVIPFARESVHYRPAPVQRRTAELVRTLGPEMTREVVAVASLANVMARLGILGEC